MDLHGVAQGLEDDAFFLGVLHLFLTGRQLGHAAAVDDVHGLGTQTHGAAGSVHGHVAAAHNGHLLAGADGGLAGGQVSLHQVGAGQELVGGVHALQALAGDAHEAGQTGTFVSRVTGWGNISGASALEYFRNLIAVSMFEKWAYLFAGI